MKTSYQVIKTRYNVRLLAGFLLLMSKVSNVNKFTVSLDLSIILADMLLLLPLHCEKCSPTGEEIRVFMQSSGQVSSLLFDVAGITARKNDLINHMTTKVTLDCGLQRREVVPHFAAYVCDIRPECRQKGLSKTNFVLSGLTVRKSFFCV